MAVGQTGRTEQRGRSSFSPEYKAEVVAWYLSSGKSIADVASELNLSESTLREWVWNTSLDGTDQPDGRKRSSSARTSKKLAEAVARAQAAEEAEASARADLVAARDETRTAYAAAVEAVLRAEIVAAAAVAEAERAAREELRAAYAAAVEAMIRAEAAADERVAQAKAVAAEMVAQAKDETHRATVSRLAAEAAAREEVAAAYASAMDAVLRAEALAAEALAQGRPAPNIVIPQLPDPPGPPAAEAVEDEATARAQIAQLVSGFAPVELWVHTAGRTLAEARTSALEQLGVDEDQAEIEVLANRGRWLPGRVQIRARVRVDETARP